MGYALRIGLTFLKITAYAGLAIMLYSNIIGPAGIAEIFKINNPSEEGLKIVGVKIPKSVLYWTLGTVVLEAVDNLFSLFTSVKPKREYTTREELRSEIEGRNLEKLKMGMRIAELEAAMKK